MLTLTIIMMAAASEAPPSPSDYTPPKPVLHSPKHTEFHYSLGSRMLRIPIHAAISTGFSITNLTVANGSVTIQWQPGTNSPPFQVQATGLDGKWVNVGTASKGNSITFPELPQHFFRIVSTSGSGYAEYPLPDLFLYAGQMRGGIKNSGGLYCWLYQETPGQENVLLWDGNGNFEIVPIFGYPNVGVASATCELVGTNLIVAAPSSGVTGQNQLLTYALSASDANGVPTLATLVSTVNWGSPADSGDDISSVTTHQGSLVFMTYQPILKWNNSVAYLPTSGSWTFYTNQYTGDRGSFGAYANLIGVDWNDMVYSFFTRDSFGVMTLGRWQDYGTNLAYFDFREEFYTIDNEGGVSCLRDGFMAPDGEFPTFFTIAYDQTGHRLIMACNSFLYRETFPNGASTSLSRPGISAIVPMKDVPMPLVIGLTNSNIGQRVTFTTIPGASYTIQLNGGTGFTNTGAFIDSYPVLAFVDVDIYASNDITTATIANPNRYPVSVVHRPYTRIPLLQLPDYQERVFSSVPMLDPVGNVFQYYHNMPVTNQVAGPFVLATWDGTNITTSGDTRQPVAWSNGYALQWRVVQDANSYTLIRGLTQ